MTTKSVTSIFFRYRFLSVFNPPPI